MVVGSGRTKIILALCDAKWKMDEVRFFLRLNELGGSSSFKRTWVARVRFLFFVFSVPHGERERTCEVRFVFLVPCGTAWASKFVQTKKKTNLIHFSFWITKSKYNFSSTTTHYHYLPRMSAKKKKGLDSLPNEIRLELRRTIALRVYDCVCSRDSMKEKDQKRLMHELFYGIEGEEEIISYLEMLLRGEGEFEELFEVVGNEGRKKIKEIFCIRTYFSKKIVLPNSM